MADNLLARLSALSEKPEALTAITVRLPKEVDRKIREFCAKNPAVRRAVVLRECLERGWSALEKDLSDTP